MKRVALREAYLGNRWPSSDWRSNSQSQLGNKASTSTVKASRYPLLTWATSAVISANCKRMASGCERARSRVHSKDSRFNLRDELQDGQHPLAVDAHARGRKQHLQYADHARRSRALSGTPPPVRRQAALALVVIVGQTGAGKTRLAPRLKPAVELSLGRTPAHFIADRYEAYILYRYKSRQFWSACQGKSRRTQRCCAILSYVSSTVHVISRKIYPSSRLSSWLPKPNKMRVLASGASSCLVSSD